MDDTAIVPAAGADQEVILDIQIADIQAMFKFQTDSIDQLNVADADVIMSGDGAQKWANIYQKGAATTLGGIDYYLAGGAIYDTVQVPAASDNQANPSYLGGAGVVTDVEYEFSSSFSRNIIWNTSRRRFI